jgi:hypothetical protein
MSVNQKIRTARKKAVEDMIWERMIKNQKKTEGGREVTKLPDLNTSGESRDRAVEHIIRHYLKHAFGNLAVWQASNSAEFPDVKIYLPTVTYRIKNRENRAKLSLNMKNFVSCLREVRRVSRNSLVNGATIVQLAEPFADLAIRYLKSTGEETRLFKKFPRDLSPAKHLAFDFVSGVDFGTLNAQEKNIIQILNTRIFKTEDQNRQKMANRPIIVQVKPAILANVQMIVQAKPVMANRQMMIQAKPRRNA